MAMSVTYVVWLIGIHSIIHGIFGVVFIMTSDYVNKSPEINYSLAALYGIMIALGLLVFCVLVCRLPICAVLFGILFGLLALAIIVLSIIYTIRYWHFFANSILDKLFFYSDTDCWVGPDRKMTIWHFLTIIFCILPLLWLFVYASLLCKYARCVCCIPCPPRACYKPPPCPQPCCVRDKWYKRFVRSKCPAYPPPPPCPPCPPLCPPPCPQPQTCPPPCPPPCPPQCPTPCSKKTPKFVLTLRPGKLSCK